MKAKLIEITFTFHVPVPAERGWYQFKVLAGKLGGRLSWSFALGAKSDHGDILPAVLVEAIHEGLQWAQAHVDPDDLLEHDRDDGCND